MDTQMHDISDLFAQFGLPPEPAAIESFIAGHSPLAGESPVALVTAVKDSCSG